jgi:hypothetical protein
MGKCPPHQGGSVAAHASSAVVFKQPLADAICVKFAFARENNMAPFIARFRRRRGIIEEEEEKEEDRRRGSLLMVRQGCN